jgi:hypothetical protein
MTRLFVVELRLALRDCAAFVRKCACLLVAACMVGCAHLGWLQNVHTDHSLLATACGSHSFSELSHGWDAWSEHLPPLPPASGCNSGRPWKSPGESL